MHSSSPQPDFENVLGRAEGILARLEKLIPADSEETAWDHATAFHWRKLGARGIVSAVRYASSVRFDDLQCIDRQKAEIERNTRQFIDNRPANHALLWGPRGTGKSSLIKAVFNAFASKGLRLIEIGKQDLGDLPRIFDRIFNRPERFILYCDDLSFEANDSAYKTLKIAIDGSMSSVPDNALIYATSNRRHLMPEYLDENLSAHNVAGEIHQTEGVEEKIALSERFGLWLAFHPFQQEEYLKIVFYWLARFGTVDTEHERVRQEALRWALLRGSRSGRAGYQFARDWAGRCGLERND